MNEGSHQTTQIPFDDCSSERVFSDISAQIENSETRTLWMRLNEEMKRQGASGATTYLNARFTTLKEDLNRELSTAKAS